MGGASVLSEKVKTIDAEVVDWWRSMVDNQTHVFYEDLIDEVEDQIARNSKTSGVIKLDLMTLVRIVALIEDEWPVKLFGGVTHGG
jgi:hypothetical protein